MRRVVLSIFVIFLTFTLLLGFSGKGVAASSFNGYGIDKDGVVTFDDKYFGYLDYEVQGNPSKYDGKKIVITGFVYKNSDFQKNEFKVARYLPSNCADDPYVLGLICRTEKAEDFQKDEWVIVKGTLVVETYVDPETSFEYERVYIKPDSIEKIPMRADYSL
jgi:uncharacterized repeat protein (TIGR03943 family)